ncbi:hypothetical protein [Shewanella putrefaciens]|uniref:hypothetical protein n=1 Tax=Shewanella putrefaciens TaxID=24 RepID=UPI003569E35C
MKNIQVIDGADNCTYDIYSVDDDVFYKIFPNQQDVEFISDLEARLGKVEVSDLLQLIWTGRCDKGLVVGIHGTLFFELDFKKKFYPTKKECEMIVVI